MSRLFNLSMTLRLALLGALIVGAGSLSAIPLKMEVTITASPTAGKYRYVYVVTLDNNDSSWSAGNGWKYFIYSDGYQPAGATNLTGVSYIGGPPAGFGTTNFGGSHTGPALSHPTYWVPTALNETITWTVDANNYLTPGELYWSSYSTTGGGVAGNYIPVTILNAGLKVAPNTGSAPLVLNNETGGGDGYEAADFEIINNSSAFALDVTAIEIEGMGDGDHTSGYTSIELFRDETASGTVGSYDVGDTKIGATATALAGSPPKVTFNVQAAEQTFATNSDKKYFIVVKLDGTAATGKYFHYRVSDFTANLGASGTLKGGLPSAQMLGYQINGDEIRVNSGTYVTAAGVVLPTTTDHPVGAFEVAATSTSAQSITSIQLHRTGTITDSEVTAVKLWVDTNANGIIDGSEASVGGSQSFSGGVATFSGSPLLSLATSASSNLIVTYSVAGLANGTTFGYSMTALTDITNSPGAAREVTAPTTQTSQAYLVTSFPYVENFDSNSYSGTTNGATISLNNGWGNDASDGGQDWYTDYNATLYGNAGTGNPTRTGPTADHTTGSGSNGAMYVYALDGFLNTSNDPVNLVSPPMDISGLVLPVAEYWLHSTCYNGLAQYENTLHFDLIDVSTGNVTADYWSSFKGQLTGWTLRTLDLSAVSASIVQIRFRVEATGSSAYNDLCIDDFGVRDLPDITVKNGSNMTVTAGGSDAIGTVLNTVTTTLNYTIENNGGADLGVSSVTFSNHNSNVNPSATVVSTPPGATVTAGNTTAFAVQFNPIGAGAFSFDVTVASNDPDTPSYTFTVSGTGQSNAGPVISIPTSGSNWVANGSNFELFVDPGATINDALNAVDPTPDNITITVTAPTTTLTTLSSSPVTGGGTASTITMDWVGTADATNAPTSYVWQIQISDGITDVNFTATIFVNDLAPTSAAGTSATGGNGQGTTTPYTGSALVGSSTALTLADMTNPNTGQTMTLGTITPDSGNPAGGSGFSVTFVADSIVLTPTTALVLADVGTHAFAVDIDDAGNTTTVFVSVEVQTPEIDVARNATAIADGGPDTITGGLAGQATVLTYDITNNGTSDLTITTVALSNLVNCAANVTVNPAGTVTPTNSTSFNVTVTPGVGSFSFDIDINNDDVDEDPYDIAVSGNAAAAPEIDVDRSGTPIADGGSDTLVTSYTGIGNDLVYTITNNGTSDLTITGITTGGLSNCTATVTVPATSPVTPGNSTDFTVQYTPTADGPVAFTITILSNDANESPYDIAVSGTATPAPSSSGSGGGGSGCASSSDSTMPVAALLALLMLGTAVYRRRRA